MRIISGVVASGIIAGALVAATAGPAMGSTLQQPSAPSAMIAWAAMPSTTATTPRPEVPLPLVSETGTICQGRAFNFCLAVVFTSEPKIGWDVYNVDSTKIKGKNGTWTITNEGFMTSSYLAHAPSWWQAKVAGYLILKVSLAGYPGLCLGRSGTRLSLTTCDYKWIVPISMTGAWDSIHYGPPVPAGDKIPFALTAGPRASTGISRVRLTKDRSWKTPDQLYSATPAEQVWNFREEVLDFAA